MLPDYRQDDHSSGVNTGAADPSPVFVGEEGRLTASFFPVIVLKNGERGGGVVTKRAYNYSIVIPIPDDAVKRKK